MRLTLPEKSAIINMLSVFICGCGGIGRRARFRFWWETVQVQVLLSAGVCKGFLSWYKVRSPFLIVYD